MRVRRHVAAGAGLRSDVCDLPPAVTDGTRQEWKDFEDIRDFDLEFRKLDQVISGALLERAVFGVRIILQLIIWPDRQSRISESR